MSPVYIHVEFCDWVLHIDPWTRRLQSKPSVCEGCLSMSPLPPQCSSPCLAPFGTAEMTWMWWESPSAGSCTCQPARCTRLCRTERRESTPGHRPNCCASWETTPTRSSLRWDVTRRLKRLIRDSLAAWRGFYNSCTVRKKRSFTDVESRNTTVKYKYGLCSCIYSNFWLEWN